MNIMNSFWGAQSSYNTYIGGAGATVTTAALLAAKLSIAEGDISNFTVSNNNIKCRINADYTFLINAFASDHNITYYLDFDGRATGSSSAPFYDTRNMKVGYFPAWASSTITQFRCLNSSNESTFFALSLPVNTPIGSTSGNESNYNFTNVINFYTHASNQTNNGGSPDGDLTDANANFTNINYVSGDTNAPDPIDDLASGNVYGSIIELTWSAPASTNTIDVYVIFKDGTPIAVTTSTSYTVYNLDELTDYDFEILVFDQEGNCSTFSNLLSETTLAYQIPVANIISYWPFDSDSLDQVGANDGTDTSMSYTSTGGIGNSADFTAGTSSKISVADATNLSFVGIPFTWVLMVKFNSLTPTTQIIYEKRNAASTDFEYLLQRSASTFDVILRDISETPGNLRRIMTITITTGVWYQITIISDGGSSISGLELYVDNVGIGTDSSAGTYVAMENGTQPLTIGKYVGGTTASFNGYIDEMAFFNVAFTEAQREDFYKNYLDGNPIQ